MAKIIFAFPVDKVHGKLAKSHRIGFAHRKASKLNYSTAYGERSTPFSQDELAAQDRFGAIGKATALRMKDPSKLMQDQAAFKEQTEYTTLRQYVWHQCANEYDAAQG